MFAATRLVVLLLALAGSALPAPQALAHGSFHDRVGAASSRIEREPANAAPYLERSVLYREHGDYALALADLEAGARLDPGRREVDLLRGRLHLARGRPDEAVPPLERLLEQSPDDPAANLVLARALAAAGRHLEASERYSRAIDHAPVALPEPYLERARTLLAAGDEHRDDALRGLDEGMQRLGPVVALAMLAIEIETQGGRVDAALARLDGLAARSPRQETWLSRRGEILERAGRREEARASYARVLAELDTLPAHRRQTPAMRQLESQARERHDRLARAPE
jgi:tetratricopeptide (TPR) repeat protein